MGNIPRVFPDNAGGLGSALVSREANAEHAEGGKEHMMRSQLAGNVWEEGRSINRDLHVQISALPVQPLPDKQRKFEGERG